MMKPVIRATIVITGIIVSTAALCNDLSGMWSVSIENPEHHVVTTLKLEFTRKQAESCMSGDWKVVKVVSSTTQDKKFFPISDPLSYQVDNGQLTIGRNEKCDAYLWLQAPLAGTPVHGEYFSLSFGESSPLGYFKLEHVK